MRRRELIAGLAGALATPLVARGEDKRPVVAVLDAKGANPLAIDQINNGLAGAGYRNGENVIVQYHGVDGHYERFPEAAAELVRNRVSVIIVMSIPGARAAEAATSSVPIVFMSGFDPVTQGVVTSLNKPGGNITGVSMLTIGLNEKRLQMLRELVPDAKRIGLLINPGNAAVSGPVDEIQGAAKLLGCELNILPAHNAEEINAAFDDITAQGLGALMVGNDPFFTSQAQQIVALAARHRIPVIYEWRDFVDAGGLASYGSDRADDYRTLGVYAGKILAGAKPGDLPVVQPTKFELVINLKTAKALGLTVPQILLAQANDVIE